MIDKLEMFIALATHAHFGKAAAACGVTQPTLSAAIKQLEAHLGVMLVRRGARFQGLTPEGQRVLERARVITGDARALRAEMHALRQGLSGHIRLAVVPTATSMVRAITVPFAARYPDVRFSIISGSATQIFEMLEDHRADAGISYLDGVSGARMVSVPLFAERYVLVMPEGHPMAARAGLAWGDIAGLPLAALTPDTQNRRILNAHFATAGVQVNAVLESNSVLALVSHVLAGTCVTVLPAKTAALFGGVVSVPIGADDGALRAGHPIGLVAPKREPYTPVLAALIEVARRAAEPEVQAAPEG